MNTLTVITAAYQAERWIGDMLQSFRAQEPKEGWKYDIRIGVDGCPETAAVLDKLQQPYWKSKENVGAYVMRNSLILLGYSDVYAIFDADDVMGPRYLTLSIDNMCTSGLSIVSGEQCDEKLNPQGGVQMLAMMTFTDKAWRMAGGFREDRIGSDTDFQLRLNALGINHNYLRVGAFKRRNHDNSLTHRPETRHSSRLRTDIIAKHKRMRDGHRKTIDHPVTTELEYVG